jgi:zinc protease
MNMAVALIAEMLRAPKFEKDAVDREIFRALEVVKNVEFNPSRKAYSQALKNIYGNHPYAYGKLGKMEDISALTPEKLRKFYLDCCAGKIVMGFAGDCSTADAEKWSAVIENAIPGGGKSLPLPEFGGFSKDLKRESSSMEREQTVVMRMIPGPEFAGNDEFDLFELLQQSENGLASTLFNEVREKHALCYSVGMNFFSGFHPGAVCFYSMTEIGAEDKVMELLNKEITRLAEDGLSEAEFEAAKTAVLFDIARNGDSAEKLLQTMAMDIYYGKDENEFTDRQERIRNFDLAAFNAAIKPYFSAPAGVEVVIKPEKK